MSEAQRKILAELVAVYTGNLAEPVARAQADKIERAGIDGIRFAWAGGTAAGQGHYYRVQGPTFVIEYDNTQNGANHVHSVFRDLDDDFGGDLLRQHYARARTTRARPAAGNPDPLEAEAGPGPSASRSPPDAARARRPGSRAATSGPSSRARAARSSCASENGRRSAVPWISTNAPEAVPTTLQSTSASASSA